MPYLLKPASIAACLALTTVSLSATAAHLEVQGGRSYMDRYATTAIFVEAVFNEHRIGNSQLTWSPDVSLGWINGRDVARYQSSRYNTRDQVSLLAAGARFRLLDSGQWYQPLFFSFQPALQTGRTQALSSSYEFVSTLGWQAQHLSFQIRHISNGGLRDPNRGETMALIGVGFDL